MGGENNIKAIQCVSCGGHVSKSYRTIDEDETIPVAVCTSCGAEYDHRTDLYYQVFADDLTYDKDRSVFRLGLKGTLDGKEYEIIGRLRYQEEEEYEKSTWDEWLAVSSEGTYHYFVEEEGKVFSYEEYVPQEIDLDTSDGYISLDGKRVRADTAYIARIVLAEGELTWTPVIGEAVTCYDIKKEGVRYTVEQSESEVSITRGDRISYEEIIEAFGLDEYRELYNNTLKKRKEYRFRGLVYGIAMVLAFGFAFYSCFSSREISGILDKKKVLSDNKAITEGGKRVYQSQVLYGPFTLPEKKSLYDVSLYVDTSVQRFQLEWQSFRFLLIKKDRLDKLMEGGASSQSMKKIFSDIDTLKEPLESFIITGDFWDEEGRDSDGYWHENDLRDSKTFVLDSGGAYYAYLEMYSNKQRKPDSVKVRMKSTKSSRYFFIAAAILFVLMGMNRSKGRTYNELPFELAAHNRKVK